MNPGGLDSSRLRGLAWLAGHEHHQELGSTNDQARQRLEEQGLELPHLVTAERQTAGRGRGTNRWWTGPESLAFSLLLDPLSHGLGRQSIPISLVAAVAVVDALRPWLADAPLGLHWPNDVFVGERKLAGILVEAHSERRCIVGIGLNVNDSCDAAPAELRPVLTSLRDELGRGVDRTAVLIEVLAEIERLLAELAVSAASVGRRFNELCLQHGRELTLVQGSQSHRGICMGVAQDGALRLSVEGEVQSFYSGVLVK